MTKHDPLEPLCPLDETQSGYHYNVMRRAIALIDAHQGDALTLDALAGQMGMSGAHFQRLFSKWAGVSPKRFQQYLTLGHAKTLLDARFTTLATADAVGLSGTGRLHDLFLRWDAMSPGQFARKGDGLDIRYDWVDTAFGDTLITATDHGICGLAFAAETTRDAAMEDMQSRWPKAQYIHDKAAIAPHADAINNRTEARLHLMGAPFQIKVWEALLQVPMGHVTTYSQIAQSVGNPRAVRAVGTAVGRNPISWLIPCHRALRKSGGLGGYHWGLPVKRAMLAYETARADAAS